MASVIEDLRQLEDRISKRIEELDSLYPVVRQLLSDGLLHKDGRGLWLAAR